MIPDAAYPSPKSRSFEPKTPLLSLNCIVHVIELSPLRYLII